MKKILLTTILALGCADRVATLPPDRPDVCCETKPNIGGRFNPNGDDAFGKDKKTQNKDAGLSDAPHKINRDMDCNSCQDRIENNFDLGRERSRDAGYDAFVDSSRDARIPRDLDAGTIRDARIERDAEISRRYDSGIVDRHDAGDGSREDAGLSETMPYRCDPNTVVLYHFDRPDIFSDACRTHNLASAGVDATESIEGFGDAVRLGGENSYLRTEDSGDLNFGRGDFTTEMRFKLNAPPSGSLLSKLLQGAGHNGFRMDHNEPWGWMCGYEDSSESITDYVYIREGLINYGFNPSLQDGRWHHFACVRKTEGDFTRIKAYVDGINVTTATFPRAVYISNRFPLLIGSILAGGSSYAPAPQIDIDEVRVSDTAREF